MLDTNRFTGDGVGIKPPQIKSIQMVDIYSTGASGTVTFLIDEVVLANSILLFGSALGKSAQYVGALAKIWLSDTTHISVTTTGTSCRYAGTVIVLEFAGSSVKSKQTGTASVTTAGLNVTISSVDPDKCLVNATYMHNSSIGEDYLFYASTLAATNLFIDWAGENGNTRDVYWEVLELR